MLSFDQIKAIEAALGTDKAGPIIHAFESFGERAKDELATKRDIDELREATKRDIDKLREATKRDIDELREATKRDIDELREATKRDIKELRQETKRDIDLAKAELQASLKDLEVKLTVRMGAMLAIVLAAIATLKLL